MFPHFCSRLEHFCTHLHAFPWAQGLAVRHNSIGKILSIKDKSTNDSVAIQCDEALGLLGKDGSSLILLDWVTKKIISGIVSS